MHFLKLEISLPGCRPSAVNIVYFIVELVKYFAGNDRLQAINNPIFVFLWTDILLLVALQQLDPLGNVMSVGHVDQSQELIFVVD